tara:strand:- start:120 stop:590 length:471 start_codon:yes stop_codon:yes gene_type:complete
MKHYINAESNAPEPLKQRNKKLMEAYSNILITIERIQGWLDDEFLRTRIESDMTKDGYYKSIINQCLTPFCSVTIGCDENAVYTICYSLDYRIFELIGEPMTSVLIRRIYEFTPGEMEQSVIIVDLQADCLDQFNSTLTEASQTSIHKIIKQKRFD